MHRGCGACGRRSLTGAGPGRTVRTTGPAKGNPVPARPAAPRLHRRPPKPALGGRLHLRADPVGVLLHRLRHGACSPAASSAGPPAAARGTDNAAGAPGQAIRRRKHRDGGDLEGPAPPQRPRISVPVHRLHRTTRRRGHRGIGRSRGLLLRQRRRRGPGQVLQARARLARRPLEGPRRPRDRHRPVGEPVPTAPDPTAPTPTTSHPPPPNTATIATTPPPPPPRPPRHNHSHKTQDDPDPVGICHHTRRHDPRAAGRLTLRGVASPAIGSVWASGRRNWVCRSVGGCRRARGPGAGCGPARRFRASAPRGRDRARSP